MTDHDPRLDELLSAHLDGETTAAEAARIERDPALVARLDELASVRDALVADRPSVDEATRDATLASVWATLERDKSPGPLTPISELPTHRRNPSRFLAVAAAAVIAVALLGGAIGMLAGESGDDDSANSSAAEMSTMDDAGAATTSGGSDERSPSQDLDESVPPSFGSFDDMSQLRDAVQERLLDAEAFRTDAAPEAGSTTAPLTASALPSTCPAPPDARAIYTAEVAGRVLLVVVTDEQLAVVLDPGTCTEVLRITQQ